MWLAGEPSEVRGVVQTRSHDIEVEDSASAMIKFENGATGYFHTSTVEQPGTYRIELCGDRGKIIFDKITEPVLKRTSNTPLPTSRACRRTPSCWARS